MRPQGRRNFESRMTLFTRKRPFVRVILSVVFQVRRLSADITTRFARKTLLFPVNLQMTGLSKSSATITARKDALTFTMHLSMPLRLFSRLKLDSVLSAQKWAKSVRIVLSWWVIFQMIRFTENCTTLCTSIRLDPPLNHIYMRRQCTCWSKRSVTDFTREASLLCVIWHVPPNGYVDQKQHHTVCGRKAFLFLCDFSCAASASWPVWKPRVS